MIDLLDLLSAKKLENFGMITRQCVQLACCLTFGGVLCFIVIIHLYIGVLIFTGLNRGDVSELLGNCSKYSWKLCSKFLEKDEIRIYWTTMKHRD